MFISSRATCTSPWNFLCTLLRLIFIDLQNVGVISAAPLHCIHCRGNHWAQLCRCISLILSIPMVINLFASSTWQSSWISCLILWLPLIHCFHAVPAETKHKCPPLSELNYTGISFGEAVWWMYKDHSVSVCTKTWMGKLHLILCCAVLCCAVSTSQCNFLVAHWFAVEVIFWMWHTEKLCSCSLYVTANHYRFVVQM